LPTSRLRRALACLIVLCVFPFTAAQALDGSFRIADFRHDVWSPKEGLPAMPIAMVQAKDGWLWIGAYRGLYRFDGVRFERFEPLPGEALLYSTISTLTTAPNGDLLIGYLTGGFSILRNGHLLHMTSPRKQPFSNTFTVQADVDGSHWAAAIDGLMHLQGGRWEKIGRDWDYPGTRTDNITLDRHGRLFVSDGAWFYMLDRTRRKFVRTGLRSTDNNADFLFDPAGNLWVGVEGRLTRVDADAGPLPGHAALDRDAAATLNQLFDRDGNLWLIAGQTRVCMLPRARLPATGTYSATALVTDGDCIGSRASAPNVAGMLEDRDGNIWVARANSLERFRQTRLRTVPYPTASTHASVALDARGQLAVNAGNPMRRYVIDEMTLRPAPVHPDAVLQRPGRPGTVLLATPQGLVVQEDGRERTIAYPPGLPPERVGRLLQEGADAFWVAWPRYGMWRYAGGHWSKPPDHGVPVARGASASDGHGTVWLGYADNTIVRLGPQGTRKYDVADGVDVRVATFIDVQREVLAGGDGGLQVLDGGRFRHLRAADPDVLTGISGLAIAPDGDRWFNTYRGVLHVRARDWQAALRAPDALLRYELLDQLDGYPDGAQVGNGGTAAVAPDGRMWFTAIGGVALYDPRHDAAAPAPPPPMIRAVIANGKRFDPFQAIVLPPGTDHVALEFTALNYSFPERTVFRYRLQGAERDWQGPLAVRYISYANLAPGRYTFALQAANAGGPWSAATATVAFELSPAFTQTLWFRALCALALAGACMLLYRWRVREVTARLHLLLRERQRIARTLHDTFLQSLQSLVWRFDQVKGALPLEHQDRRLLDTTLAQANEVMAEGRHQILGLRPGADEGLDLEARLATALDALRARHAAAIDIAIDNPRSLALLPIVADEAYHIANEALRNALYHSRATRLDVRLEYGAAAFVLRVADDGGGFDPALLAGGGRDGHWGLTGMRERARAIGAALAIDTGEQGTTVTLRVPKAVAYGRLRRARSERDGEEARC
jgi:signal transduction histidine kinase/ligand-binding sensor domain-containing protein